MCRNIRTLFNFEPPVTDAEIDAAALQFVRKISGLTRPTNDNEAAFADAVLAVGAASRQLLSQLKTRAAPKNREVEAEKARARSQRRFARN